MRPELKSVVGCALGALLASGGVASADTFSFINITGNSTTDAAAGESQLRVDITSFSATQVLFTFYHVGATPMSITDVYFDDGSLLGIASIINGAGVAFSQTATPPELPGANAVGFVTTVGFLADSDPPAQPNGVNPGETLGIVFDLIAGQDFADVIAAMGLGFADGGLVIGIHVQGFDGGGSEAFITTPGTPIPLPTPALLGLAGLAPLAMRRRR